MSILIKGMEMPKKDVAVYLIYHYGNETVEAVSVDKEHHTLHCEVVEVPEPHGRLVDADFMKELGAKCIARRCDDGVLLALGRIDDLPTVIEAEE